jgi:hypothetical protein
VGKLRIGAVAHAVAAGHPGMVNLVIVKEREKASFIFLWR